jgi:phosphohistidine swiveling domain-containing protein
MSAARAIDTAPHPELRCYSRGNLAEVAPSRWSIASWSLVGDPVERGLRAFTRRLSPSARWASGSHYVFVGYFCCQPYHNLSALCRLARELPGVSEQDLTRSYFENATPPEWDRASSSGRLERLSALPRMVYEFHRLRPRLVSLEADVALCEERILTALASDSAVALGGALEHALRVLDDAWEVHYSTTGALVFASALQRALGTRVLQRWDELEPHVNRAPELPWSRLRDGAGDGALEAGRFLELPFYEVGDAHEPWRSYARTFTPQSTPTTHEPERGEIAEVVWRMYPRARLTGIEQLSRVVADTLQAREESKALAMRMLHVFRRALPRLAAEARLSGDAWTYLRIGEVLAPGDRAALVELVERRREECAQALAEQLPDQLITPIDMPRVAPQRMAHDRLEGDASGVSPGVAVGVVVRPESASANGELARNGPVILVCDSADAGIQTLLPKLAGLITLRGSMLSHISTMAREYGVPTVVNHPLAETLAAGQRVSINGSTGEVEVIR